MKKNPWVFGLMAFASGALAGWFGHARRSAPAPAGLTAAGLRPAVEHLMRITPQSRRYEALQDLVRQLPVSELPQALAEAFKMGREWRHLLIERLAARWAEAAPQAALKYAAGLGSAQFRIPVQRAALLAWAHEDPTAAGQWLEQLPAKDQRRELSLAAMEGDRSFSPGRKWTPRRPSRRSRVSPRASIAAWS